MEKKGTKITYFIALAIVVIALVIAKVTNDGSGFIATGWALFPPVVAIALALISKEVYSSLFLGCLAGALLLANFDPWQMVVNFVGAGEGVGMINAIDISILIFLVMLGVMVDLMNKAGGSAAFGRWASKAVKTRCGAQLLTMLLGVLIFIDDYFNCLTVGAVMRPVTESHKISRAKLAYVIDATAAPVCMLAPVSSWAAAVASYVPDGFPGSRISMFLSQIPWNYYCILTLIMVITISVLNIDYGPMLTHEYNAQVKDDLFTTPERPFEGADDYEEGEKHSSVLDLLLPVIVLIGMCIVGLIWTGGVFDPESENYQNFVMAFSDASAGPGLCLGSIVALVFTFVYYWLRGLIKFEKSMESIPNGFIQMISPILILCFAWTLCGLCRDDGLQVGEDELGVDGVDVVGRIDLAVDVDDVVVFEGAYDLADRVGLADVGEELVAQAFAFGGALDDACDVDEGDGCRHDLLGVHELGEHRQTVVRQRHDAGVRLDGGERIVFRQHVVTGQCVEHGGLADVRQSDDSDSKRHGSLV